MYRFFAVVLFVFMGNAFAGEQVIDQVLTVKERVRLNLWYQGLSDDVQQSKDTPRKISVELETAIDQYDL